MAQTGGVPHTKGMDMKGPSSGGSPREGKGGRELPGGGWRESGSWHEINHSA